MKQSLFALLLLTLFSLPGGAKQNRRDSLQLTAPVTELDSLLMIEEYVDTFKLKDKKMLNNYWMVGFDAGVTKTSVVLNPKVSSQIRPIVPGYWAITLTHYEKMFDYLPYFAFQIGFAHDREGYQFKPAGKSGNLYFYPNDLCSAVRLEVYEIPAAAQIHFDYNHFKVMAHFGVYGGYRTAISRTLSPNVERTVFKDYIKTKFEPNVNKFYDTDNRWDYGMHGGAGFGLIFAPIEIHFGANLRYAWSSFFQPDTTYPADSEYADRNAVYYRFATPLDITFYAGIHVHLSRRMGKTLPVLRREAKETVYGKPKTENPAGEGGE